VSDPKKSERSDPILVNAEAAKADLGARGIVPRPALEEWSFQMPEEPTGCFACGRFHGSVRAHIACLGAEVVRLRGAR
jgi:hypothetical protein